MCMKVDAFQLSDNQLNSCLGRYDGTKIKLHVEILLSATNLIGLCDPTFKRQCIRDHVRLGQEGALEQEGGNHDRSGLPYSLLFCFFSPMQRDVCTPYPDSVVGS